MCPPLVWRRRPAVHDRSEGFPARDFHGSLSGCARSWSRGHADSTMEGRLFSLERASQAHPGGTSGVCVCACMQVCVCAQSATGQGSPMCRPQGRRSQGPTCLLVQPRTSPRLTYPCGGCGEGRAADVLAQDHEDKKPVFRLDLGFWAVGGTFSRILVSAQ